MAKLEEVLIEMARLQGQTLNGHDLLLIRTRAAAAMAARERHRRRMNAKPYQWRKPERPR